MGEYTPLPFPIVLQQRAQEAQRTAFLRSALRIAALVTGDLLLISLAAMTIRALRTLPYMHDRVAEFAQAVVPAGVFPRQQLLIAAVLGLAICGSYGRSLWRTPRPVMSGFMLGSALVSWTHLWARPTAPSIVGFFLTAMSVGLLLTLGRDVQGFLVKWIRPRTLGVERTLVVGDSEFARSVMAYEPIRREQQLAVVGFVDVAHTPAKDSLGGVPELVGLIEEHKVEALLLSPRLEDELFLDILYAADSASVEAFVLGSAYAEGGFSPSIVIRGSVPLVQLTRPALRAHQLLIKRVFDICGSLVLMVLASPLLLAAAILVKVTSRGPMLFRQLRVGHGGQLFPILKFRSMVSDAEHLVDRFREHSLYGDERLFKLEKDPRVTPLGVFMRRTSIDELPQLWNVLKGDMSLVGPRPPLPHEVALYDEHHFARFGMKPGITGPWQVSGRNNIRKFEEVLAIESAYLNGWNIWKDLDIVLRTVPVVLSMNGAS
jgi:exopolysaccharide biosynthesis polyprenyl glycosylphosphotransferase